MAVALRNGRREQDAQKGFVKEIAMDTPQSTGNNFEHPHANENARHEENEKIKTYDELSPDERRRLAEVYRLLLSLGNSDQISDEQ